MNDQNNDAFLKIKAEVEKVQEMYAANPSSKTLSFLLLGETGSGKSFLMRTARKPVHIDIFDKGGDKNLRKQIEKGEIIADMRWADDDPLKPSKFRDWEKETKRRIAMGYFDHFGTYCLDSSSTWATAIMNQQLKAEGMAGKAPRFTKDYVPQKVKIVNWINILMQLPCDFVLTGHLQGDKDEVSGRMSYRYMVTGQASVTVPLLFDEVYVMDPKGTPSGVEYRILTQATGRHIARSRLAEDGLLAAYEKPDIKHILKKCGFDYKDKPLFNQGK